MSPMIFMRYSISPGNPPFDIMHYRHFAYVHIFLHLFRHSFSSSHSCIVHVHPLYVVISFWRRPVVSGSMVHMAISTLHLKHFCVRRQVLLGGLDQNWSGYALVESKLVLSCLHWLIQAMLFSKCIGECHLLQDGRAVVRGAFDLQCSSAHGIQSRSRGAYE